MPYSFPTPFQPLSHYDLAPPDLTAYNNMLVQPFLAMQSPRYHLNQQVPTQDCSSRSVTSPFVKELLEYEIPNATKIPQLKTYDGTTDPDSHIDTYERTITSLKLDERF